ncbi:uncharacterized protein [Pagrus major]|uniref:uncharacterized protein n=1 Tax=Pagrus major TaxID=143350 RepID=UPI003CC84622
MVAKTVFLLALFGIASSKLPHDRKCDPEPEKDTPTHCSNNKNILYLNDHQAKIEEKQRMLEEKISALEAKTGKITGLETSVSDLSSALKDLEKMKTQLQKHKVDIASLKREVRDLVKHRERVGGNFSEIEKKLDATEKQLRDKTAKLENLETETEVAFNGTQRLLNLYKNELSNLTTTAQKLEVKVEARLDSTKTELDAKLKKIQNKNEAFSTKLNEQKAKVDEFKGETDRKFRSIDTQLKTQKTTVGKQKADIDSLKSNTAGFKTRLGSAEGKLAEQNTLKKALNKLTADANAKVAFSATITASNNVFTGPGSSHRRTLIFNRVFTNIGKAYNSKTGIFTAPRKGVYHFSFMTFGYCYYTSGAILVKNGHYQVSTWEFKGPDTSDTTSNTVILELNVGETVSIILWRGGKVHSSVFSGFLVFPIS